MAQDEPAWLDWAKRLQAMAQTGLTYAQDPYDIGRYHEIAEISAAMMARGTGTPIEQVRDAFADAIGHATPKVDVRTAVFRTGVQEGGAQEGGAQEGGAQGTEILLVREMSDGLWTLPGGWADVGESPSEAAAREVLEESGYVVRITRFLAMMDKRKHPHPPDVYYIYKLFFAGEIVGTDGSKGGDGKETDGVGFFTLDALPPLSLKRALPSQIAQLFALHAAGDGAPALFD